MIQCIEDTIVAPVEGRRVHVLISIDGHMKSRHHTSSTRCQSTEGPEKLSRTILRGEKNIKFKC